jgi:hypothetical protein
MQVQGWVADAGEAGGVRELQAPRVVIVNPDGSVLMSVGPEPTAAQRVAAAVQPATDYSDAADVELQRAIAVVDAAMSSHAAPEGGCGGFCHAAAGGSGAAADDGDAALQRAMAAADAALTQRCGGGAGTEPGAGGAAGWAPAGPSSAAGVPGVWVCTPADALFAERLRQADAAAAASIDAAARQFPGADGQGPM